ncbi:hypothetical protein V1505DRAFT_362314 [Lipomyces doorenjongii]
MIVAPLTSPRDAVPDEDAYLASTGRHVDIFSGIVYDGNREIYYSTRCCKTSR